MLWITSLVLFTLAIALARAKSSSSARPRGRFARSVAWGSLPELPARPVRARAAALARSVGLL